jgi:trans-aconitate 2-methyltransferase
VNESALGGGGLAPPKQDWDASLYDSQHAFVWRFGADLLELLAPKPGERVLDLGCGTGHLTNRIAETGAEVVGLDNAPAMIEQARRNYPGLQFEVGDGANFAFPEPFDAVFSNAALHWMKPPERVAACIARALKPGGRLVAELGGKGNVEQVVAALREATAAAGLPLPGEPHPWYFPSVGEYASLLEASSLAVAYAALFDRPTPLEGGEEGFRNWVRMFWAGPLAAVPTALQADIIQAAEARLRPRFCRDGTWVADYRRLRVVAVRDALARGKR